jgi:flagellar protein FliS
MQYTTKAIGAYQNAMKTVPPLQAVVMLYDGVLARIARAAQANLDGDYERQFNEVMSAAKIVDGLNRCLDMEVGGAVAANLRSLYETISTGLLRSTGRQYGATYLKQLGDAVRVTRDAWAEIAGIPSSKKEVSAA